MAGKLGSATVVWVVQQHDQFTVVESKEMPSTKVEPGQRGKAVFGPYASRAEADALVRTMEGRTLRGKREGR